MKNKKQFVSIILCLSLCLSSYSQSVSGKLSQLATQEIRLEGFNGLKTDTICSSTIDEKGNFKLNYSKADYGIGYLISADKKAFFVILSGEDIELVGEALSIPETIKIAKGIENQYLEQYANEHPRREQALSAWVYLEKIYNLDPLFSIQKTPSNTIQIEKRRIKEEDTAFLSKLPNDSYVNWFLPTRKLVSSVHTIAQLRTEEIPATIRALRSLHLTDQRLYKSGLFKDAIDGHFWLLENSGKSLDEILAEMKISIDTIIINLQNDEKKLNEATDYLFDLLERQSLFEAAEYLALKVLNETHCMLEPDLSKQLESYRTMKKGNKAADIIFTTTSYLNGNSQTMFHKLSDVTTPYTLVFFGASWCPKCTEELSKLTQNYVKWRNLGVEVVYISLDTDQQMFEELVKNYPFLAYCDYKKWESQAAKDFYVFGTPTLYLLNSERNIVLRPKSVTQVDSWVDWFLVQGNK